MEPNTSAPDTSVSSPIPQIPVTPAPSTTQIPYAGFFPRLAAFLFDFALFIPLVVLLVFGRAYMYSVLPHVESSRINTLFLLLPLVFPLYNVILLHRRGTTFGKKFLKLQIVSDTNTPLTFSQIILRELLGKFISSFFCIGYIWVLFDSKKQGFHDMIAGTYVIKTPSASVGKRSILAYVALFGLYAAFLAFVLIIWYRQVSNSVFPCGRDFKHYASFEEALQEPLEVCALYVGSSDLSEIPSSIGTMKNLKFFHASNNQIKELPPEFWTLRSLVFLDISNNNLVSIPAEVGNLTNLEHLNISKNQLSTLPKEVGELKRIKYFMAYDNNFSEQEKIKIKGYFPQSPRLVIELEDPFSSTAPTPSIAAMESVN